MDSNIYVQRRRDLRAGFNAASVIVRKRRPEREILCVGEDVSLRGMRLKLTDKEALNERDRGQIEFYISNQDRQQRVITEGTVAWVKEVVRSNNVEYHVGIKFSSLSQEHKTLISKAIISDGLTEGQRLEYEARNAEIDRFAQNGSLIITTVLSAGLIFVGYSITHTETFIRLMPITVAAPLILIEFGFRLYKAQLQRMRRVGSYIRCFIEPGFKKTQWEENLYRMRLNIHSIYKREKQRRSYSLEFYYVALYLSFLPLGMTLYILMDSGMAKIMELGSRTVILSFAVYFYWIAYRIPQIRKESKNCEGAGRVDNRQFYLWQILQKQREGFCKITEHFKEILKILWEKDIPRGILNRKKRLVQDRRSCASSRHCDLNEAMRNLIEILAQKDNEVKADSFVRNWPHIILQVLFIVSAVSAIIYYSFFKDPISFWLLTATFFIISTNLKVKMKKIYFRDKDKKLISIETDKTSKEKPYVKNQELFPTNYVKTKSKRLLSWILLYGWSKLWAREKDTVYLTPHIKIGKIFYRLHERSSFMQDRWNRSYGLNRRLVNLTIAGLVVSYIFAFFGLGLIPAYHFYLFAFFTFVALSLGLIAAVIADYTRYLPSEN